MFTRHQPKYYAPEWIRTTDLPLRRRLLYPAELRALRKPEFAEYTYGRGRTGNWQTLRGLDLQGCVGLSSVSGSDASGVRRGCGQLRIGLGVGGWGWFFTTEDTEDTETRGCNSGQWSVISNQ